MTADAYHMTSTHPEGLGAARAMQIALKEAGITIADVDYLNMHATSTAIGDLSELKAVTSLTGTEKNKYANRCHQINDGSSIGCSWCY